MDTIILAGGYGTRLGSIVEKTPKPLLEVGGKPVLSHVFDALDKFYSHKETKGMCYLTVNKKYEKDFKKFLEFEKFSFPLKLIIEDSVSDANKPGVIRAYYQVFQEYLKDSEEIMIIPGDNVFSFNLYDLFVYYQKHTKRSVIGLYDTHDLIKARAYGCAELEKHERNLGRKILKFEEKPKNPKSTLVNTTCFILKKADLESIEYYLKLNMNKGHLDWLIDKGIEVNGLIFKGYWFDIGTPESLEEARQFFRR
jgi:NDP-sugar pyrophosphorylase family protein